MSAQLEVHQGGKIELVDLATLPDDCSTGHYFIGSQGGGFTCVRCPATRNRYGQAVTVVKS